MQALTCNFIKKDWHRCFPVNSCEILWAAFSIEHLWWMLLRLLLLLNRDLNRDCLVYMFSLRFSGSKFLINLRWQFCVHKIFFVLNKIFCKQVFARFAVFSFCVLNYACGCLVYMFSLCFSGSKVLINLRRQFRVSKIFRAQVFGGICSLFILCLKLLFQKCIT